MNDRYIYYRSGYKYQLAEDYHQQITIRPSSAIETQFIDLPPGGAGTRAGKGAKDKNNDSRLHQGLSG